MKFLQVVLLCALCWATTGCAQRGIQESPTGNATEFLYVANQGEATVSVVDMSTNKVVETIDLKALGFSENAKPHHIAVEPDGSYWYLSMIGENKVLKFNRANELAGQTEFEVPGMLAVHPTDGKLMVGRSMSAVNPPQSIGIINRSDMSLEEISVLYPRPHALVVDPRGDYVYSASLAQNQIASVDAAEESVDLTSISGPVHTFVQFALSPDGNTMVATTELTGKLMIFDTSTPLQPVLVDSISVNAAPWHPVYSSDGQHV
ncbi:MAG TPA: YncE family protein, partial [Rhodothermales bacterium]|nr:YncE family protein [Rhodothermales bacterium]